MANRTCSVGGCARPYHALGLCNKHHQRLRKYGTTDRPRRPSFEERFWAKVDRNGPIPEYRPDLGPCWLWTGALHPSGHGNAYRDGSFVRPHRVTWEWFVGPVLDGLELDHLCRVRSCCNPSHLEPVTRKENIRRGLSGVLKTHCAQGHPWIPENIRVNGYKKGAPMHCCRLCKLERDAHYRETQRHTRIELVLVDAGGEAR